MYITTFYSFKGGVGRTLSLVNVAVELARKGRRVLLVDFDLEAPGLHTFEALKPLTPHPGIVEYVSEFKATLTGPSVSPYVYEVEGVAQGTGHLWVMPSGKGNDTYRLKLAAIDWRELYDRYDGYLLLEDLKTQWQKLYQPDYVFIDSRTGHTDVEGICTRQLPDAVVCLFFPNAQNLDGLSQVVADIRSEAKGPRHKKIKLHFVMSNVPDLDDEEQILNNQMDAFRNELGYDELTATIHRYEIFALLNQVIFTQSRPNSRLTREYLVLKDAIVGENFEDRDAAVRFLKDSYHPWGFTFHLSMAEVEARLEIFLQAHPRDGEVLFLIAMVYKAEQRFDDALALLDRAVASDFANGAFLIERAGLRQKFDVPAAITDIKHALTLPTLGASKVEKAIQLLRKLEPASLAAIPNDAAVNALDVSERISIADSLQWNRTELTVAHALLMPLAKEPGLDPDSLERLHFSLILCFIGLGRFVEATQLIELRYPNLDDMSLSWSFNYAMAQWGRMSRASCESFARVIRLQEESNKMSGADRTNYLQCLAISFWAIGDVAAAQRSRAEAEQLIQQRNLPSFSCWRYYKATVKEFLQDCQGIGQLIQGEDVCPIFFTQQSK